VLQQNLELLNTKMALNCQIDRCPEDGKDTIDQDCRVHNYPILSHAINVGTTDSTGYARRYPLESLLRNMVPPSLSLSGITTSGGVLHSSPHKNLPLTIYARYKYTPHAPIGDCQLVWFPPRMAPAAALCGTTTLTARLILGGPRLLPWLLCPSHSMEQGEITPLFVTTFPPSLPHFHTRR
jgi:hypothetical protein